MKMLVVYNICELSGKKNFPHYKKCLNSLWRQKFEDVHIVVSGCGVTESTKQSLLDNYKSVFSFNFVDSKIPVNTNFNHSVKKCVEKYGVFDTYLYVDSGVDVERQSDILSYVYDLINSGPYSIATIKTDTDLGIAPDIIHKHGIDVTKPFVMPVGCAINLHISLFSEDLRKAFNHCLPDIFGGCCSESVLTFMCAAIQKKWIVGHRSVVHYCSIDGPNRAYCPVKLGFIHMPWNQTWSTTRTMAEVVSDPEAYACGFGYEECNRILMHNPDCYDENDMAKEPERLLEFIKHNIFLQKGEFDYDSVQHQFLSPF